MTISRVDGGRRARILQKHALGLDPKRLPVLRARLGCPVVAVQTLAHFLARLEKRDALLIDRHMRAGARIAAGASGTMLHRKRTESAELDPVAPRQRRDDLIE